MSYLLAKILFLLLLAALCGAALTWWMLRRRYQDVTEEYSRSQLDWTQWRKALEERLGRPLAIDTGPLEARLASVESSIRGIDIPKVPPTDFSPVLAAIAGIRIPPPQAVDLAPVQAGLAALEGRVMSIPAPDVPPPTDLTPALHALAAIERKVAGIVIPQSKETDLAPIVGRLAQIEESVRGIRIPPPPPPVDLGPIQQRIGELDKAVKSIVIPQAKDVDLAPTVAHLAQIDQAVRNIRIPAPTPAVDLSPLQIRIDEVVKALRAIVIPVPKETDLGTVLSRLSDIERRLAGIRIPEIPAPAAPVNLGPIVERLQSLEARLIQEAEKRTAAKVRPGSRNLLHQPDYGKPDDLKRIKGVAKVLEKMLHGIGVYYFWQIAEWTTDDVAHVDSLLTAFKGRVERDHWVMQAVEFVREPTSARKP